MKAVLGSAWLMGLALIFGTSAALASDLPERSAPPAGSAESTERVPSANKETWDQEGAICQGTINFNLANGQASSVEFQFEMVGQANLLAVTPAGIDEEIELGSSDPALWIAYYRASVVKPGSQEESVLAVSVEVGVDAESVPVQYIVYDPLLIAITGSKNLSSDEASASFYEINCGPASVLEGI